MSTTTCNLKKQPRRTDDSSDSDSDNEVVFVREVPVPATHSPPVLKRCKTWVDSDAETEAADDDAGEVTSALFGVGVAEVKFNTLGNW